MPQAQASLLDQVQKQNAVAGVLGSQFNDPAEAQVSQHLTGRFLTGGDPVGKTLFFSAGGQIGHFLQEDPQGIPLLKVLRGQRMLCSLHLLLQSQCCLAAGCLSGQSLQIQQETPGFKLLKRLLQNLFVLALQHGEHIHSPDGIPCLPGAQIFLPGAGFK